MIQGKYYSKHSITGRWEYTVWVYKVQINTCIVVVTSISEYTSLKVGDEFTVNKSDWHTYILSEPVDMTTNEGRLVYAKHHYSIGTKYKPLAPDGFSSYLTYSSEYYPTLWNGDNIEVGVGLIYHHGINKWAEIINEPNVNEPVMEKQTLTREQVKEIYDIACSDWQYKIKNYVLVNSGTFSNKVTFDNEMVSKMFKAATSNQLPVLERLLKRPVQQIEFNEYYVYVVNYHGTYKLHKIQNDEYAWIDMFTSNFWANGTHKSGQDALNSMLKKDGCKLTVLESKREIVNYFKSL